MTDQWLFKSETYDNCNCQINCGCQFNLPSTNGYCQSAFIGHIVEGHFNDTPLVGLNWAALYKWPGEIKDGNGHAKSSSTSARTKLKGSRSKQLSRVTPPVSPSAISSPSLHAPARSFARPCSCRSILRPI